MSYYGSSYEDQLVRGLIIGVMDLRAKRLIKINKNKHFIVKIRVSLFQNFSSKQPHSTKSDHYYNNQVMNSLESKVKLNQRVDKVITSVL